MTNEPLAPTPETPSATSDAPTPVSLDELAAASSTPVADAHAARVAALRRPLKRTPAGLPKGAQWLPHDTGRLGLAAARRRAQAERLAAKRARQGGATDGTLLPDLPPPDALP
jgi:hypothetical protein